MRISKADFDNALLHDVKPAYGVSEEEFDRYIRSGLLNNICGALFSMKMVEATPFLSFQAS